MLSGVKMLRSKLFKYITSEKRKILMSTSTESAEFEKKLQHYRHLNEMENNEAKPEGWDKAKPFSSIPAPRSLPIIGNVWFFMLPKFRKTRAPDLVTIHKHMKKTYGDVTVIKSLVLEAPIVILFNPKDYETLFRNEGVWPIRSKMPSMDYFRDMRKDVYPNFGLVSHTGETWFKIRSTVNPILMQPKNITQYTDKMDLVAEELVQNIKYFSEKNKDGEMPSDFKNELYKWSLESVAIVTLDTHLGCLKRDLEPESVAQKMIDSVTQFFELIYRLDVLPSMWKYYSTPDWKQFVSVFDFIIKTNISHINRALDKLEKEPIDSENTTKSVLQQLLKKDKDIAVIMAIDMLLAGVDTTGRVLGAALYFLGKNPQKQEKLREEAKNLLETKNTPITKEILSKASYLKAVIKEAARIAPIAVGNMRKTVKDLVLGGYQIPKGTNILTSNLVNCMMDEHFPKPEEFLPERWLSSTSDEFSYRQVNPFVYAPFGYGPRSCIGKRLANLELEVALLKIIRNFEISWPHEDMTFETTTLYGIAKPLKIRVKSLDN